MTDVVDETDVYAAVDNNGDEADVSDETYYVQIDVTHYFIGTNKRMWQMQARQWIYIYMKDKPDGCKRYDKQEADCKRWNRLNGRRATAVANEKDVTDAADGINATNKRCEGSRRNWCK